MHHRHLLKIKSGQIVAEGWGLAALVAIFAGLWILAG